MRKITVELRSPYTVLIERDSLAHAGSLVKKYLGEGGQAALITTRPIRELWGARVEESLRHSGVRATTLEMKDGERHKSCSTVEELAEKLAEMGADRGLIVVALGGGVVGDVAGFLAAVYMRGVDLIQIPTTLVAMIDSAIGGKTGVNLRQGKNLLGAYHQPRAVLVDPAALATLPEREMRSGLAEAIKYGVIRDRELFAFIERHRRDLLRREPAPLEAMIGECVRLKAAVVAADERESDLRRILNFGHTLGHALESATEYRQFLHGEAVAWGMIAATRLAAQLRRLDGESARRIEDLVASALAPLPAIEVTPERILAHAATDKKSRGGVLHFVLPRAIGQVEIVKNINPDAVRRTLAEVVELSHRKPAAASR